MSLPTDLTFNRGCTFSVSRSSIWSGSALEEALIEWGKDAKDEWGDPYVGSFIVHYEIDDASCSEGFLRFEKQANTPPKCEEIKGTNEELASVFPANIRVLQSLEQFLKDRIQ